MKTVLIVEDEKLIRQGIKTMIQRSGVPVDVIMECGNGEMALEVIKEQQIDVMFTDIRMPRMDGITLVQKMQECEHVPLTVAISGYDDFSYAVEMLRNGVREYILKPVEREKVTDILKKLNEEIESRQEKEKDFQKFGYQQMKHLMLLESITEEELQSVEKQYEKEFYGCPYRVCAQCMRERKGRHDDNHIYLKEIEDNDIFIVPETELAILLKNELQNGYAGISRSHQGLRELRDGYREAATARKRAFCQNMETAYFGEEEHIPEKLIEEAAKFLTESSRLQRVQLLGTDRTGELERVWNQFFYEVENGRILPEQYEECMKDFFAETEKTYRNVIGEDTEMQQKLAKLFEEDCIADYEEKLLEWVMALHEKINNQLEGNKNSQKIQQAVEYVEKNYAGDLNMAVVSNYISMNYSLFSYSFKQYTGKNFVNFLKDIRMREAKRLLTESDMRIVEISQAVGYDNEKHFMKIFKASCGVSPSEYRKNMQQNQSL